MDKTNASEQLIALFNLYDSLTDPMEITMINVDAEGKKSINTQLVRASKHFEITNIKDRLPDDDIAKAYLDKAKFGLATNIFHKTKSVLSKRFYDNKIPESEYKRFDVESKHLEKDHFKMYCWAYDVCVFLDIISDAKIVEYAVIKDESGVIQGMQQLPDRAEQPQEIVSEEKEEGETESDNQE